MDWREVKSRCGKCKGNDVWVLDSFNDAGKRCHRFWCKGCGYHWRNA